MATQTVSKKLADLLATKNLDVKFTNAQGQNSSPVDADVMSFDWSGPSGQNYGTVVIVIDDTDLLMFFGDNLGRSMDDPQDKTAWLGSEDQQGFVQQIKNFATRNNIGTFTLMDINQLKHHMAGMAAIKEGLFEGYYGNRKVSYMGEATAARLVIKHNRTLGETDKRYRYVESLFIETADGERFKLPFVKLAGGRAMLEHVRQGGRPYDIRGCHIAEMVTEMNVLSRFRRASQGRVFEGSTANLVESANNYYEQIKNNLAVMSSSRGYKQYFESWTPADINSETQLVENIKEMFVQQTLDNRIESALPILAKIQQQGTAMKEVEIFETWANRLVEGTWALPDTPEAQEKLNELRKQELIVGPDATNAKESLYDVIGDDQLFDILNDLARQDPRANIWDDSDVQARLAELGIQTPQSTEAEPADVAQDTAPPQQGVAEGKDNLESLQAKAKQISDEIDSIVQSGGRVGLDDPLSRQLKAIRNEINNKIKQAKQGVAEESSYNKYSNLSNRGVNRGINRAADDFNRMMDLDQAESPHYKTQHQQDIKQRLKTKQMAGPKGVLPEQGMAEGSADKTVKVVKRRGKPIGEIGIDPEASPGNGSYYVKLYDGSVDLSGFDTAEEALAELKYLVKQSVAEGTESQSDYDARMRRLAAQYNTMSDDKKASLGKIPGRAEQFQQAVDYVKKHSKNNQPGVAEGTCNQTMEGEYCPEHGLAECAMEEGWKGELAGGTLGSIAGTMAGQSVAGPLGALVGGGLAGTAGGMIGRKLGDLGDDEPKKLAEIAPLVGVGAAAARALIPQVSTALSKVGPKLAQMFSRAGQAAAPAVKKGAEVAAAGAGQAAKQGAEIAAKNAIPIGIGAGAYKGITDITDIAKGLPGGVGKVYDDVTGAVSAIGQAVGTAVDENTIKELAILAVKYALPVGIVLALLYGGKKAIDKVMAESADDPINHNAAVTGSYYESDELARIKKLALLK